MQTADNRDRGVGKKRIFFFKEKGKWVGNGISEMIEEAVAVCGTRQAE